MKARVEARVVARLNNNRTVRHRTALAVSVYESPLFARCFLAGVLKAEGASGAIANVKAHSHTLSLPCLFVSRVEGGLHCRLPLNPWRGFEEGARFRSEASRIKTINVVLGHRRRREYCSVQVHYSRPSVELPRKMSTGFFEESRGDRAGAEEMRHRRAP